MILFFWAGGPGGGNGQTLLAVFSFLVMMFVPSLVNIMYLGSETTDDLVRDVEQRPHTDGTLPFHILLLLQIVLPMAVVGVVLAALTNENVRRLLRLGPLEAENGDRRQQTRRRAQVAAIAAKIRSLPLIEYKSRRDLELMPLKDLVDYRNETRKKGYRAINTSTGKRQSDLLQSKEDVINDICGGTVGEHANDDNDDEEGDLCSICFAAYETNDLLRVLPRCGHVFHAECGDLWFVREQTCPLCKTHI